MENILDSDFINPSQCDRRDCPRDEDLKLYPRLPEDQFNAVDEKLFYCQICKDRLNNRAK